MNAHETGWKVYPILTTTGEVGSAYDPSQGSWSIELNSIEELDITVQKKELLTRSQEWWAPYSGGLLLTYTGEDRVEYPIIAGPIYDYGQESLKTLELRAAGIRKIFERRTVWHDLTYRAMTYGEIAWKLCEHGMDKPGGQLPIRHGVAYETGRYQRTYEQWNLANNAIDKRWTELSEVINGPDIMFRPQWADSSHRRIEWVMVHGTTTNTAIAQDRVPDFDTTAPSADVGEPSIITGGEGLFHRIWCTGSGEGEGIVREYSQDLQGINQYQPFMETVISDSDQDKPDVLRAKAEGALRAAQSMSEQVFFDVHAGSPKNSFGTYHVGDTANVTLGAQWIALPAGSYPMKIIKANGSLGQMVTLDFQESDWG